LQILRTKIKFNNFKVIEKGLLISNEDALRFIGKENIKNNSEKYQIFVNEQIEKIKSVFLSALKKKSFTKIAIVLIESTSYLAIFYLSLLGFQENSNSPFISFVIYNLFALFFGVRFLSKMRDANVFALISQQNAQIAKTENQDDASSNDSSSGNEILIENIELQDVDLEIKNHAMISKVNFFAKIKDNIAFLSSENNISLIRLFFENQDIKISGRSSINNYELHELKKENLAQIISVISWEINVDNDTIKNNLIQGNAGISDELLVKACKLSYLYNFIALLPLGFFTILNNSIELTKLEKFQISLTRALLGDAHIIVVDFTGLDEENPIVHSIKEMLFSSLVDRILIVLTKDTFGMRDMKQIIFYENENQVGHGAHEELLKSNKKYSDFYLKNYKNVEFSEES